MAKGADAGLNFCKYLTFVINLLFFVRGLPFFALVRALTDAPRSFRALRSLRSARTR